MDPDLDQDAHPGDKLGHSSFHNWLITMSCVTKYPYPTVIKIDISIPGLFKSMSVKMTLGLLQAINVTNLPGPKFLPILILLDLFIWKSRDKLC